MLRGLEHGWLAARARLGKRRSTSRAVPAVDLLAAAPLLSATTLARSIGMSIKSATEMLDAFVDDGIAVEVTHRAARRLFGLAGMAPVRDVAAPPRRPVPGRGRGRPPMMAALDAEPIPPPVPAVASVARFAWPDIDYGHLEDTMATLDASVRRTQVALAVGSPASPQRDGAIASDAWSAFRRPRASAEWTRLHMDCCWWRQCSNRAGPWLMRRNGSERPNVSATDRGVTLPRAQRPIRVTRLLGYVPLAETACELMFQVIADRAGKAAVIVTTDLPFSEWSQVIPNPRLCKALIDPASLPRNARRQRPNKTTRAAGIGGVCLTVSRSPLSTERWASIHQQRDLSVPHDKIGDVQQAHGDLTAALASYQVSLAICDRLAKADPGNAGWQSDLAVSYSKVGRVKAAQGDKDAALRMFRQGRDIVAHLEQISPTDATLPKDLVFFNARIVSPAQ